MGFFDRVEDAAERWDVLRHPFYTRWSSGALTHHELAFYAGEYRHVVVALAETARRASGADHAAEEEAHVELWDRFARALGADTARPPRPETAGCAAAWSAEGPDGLAVLYAVESAQPAISRTKLEGLLEHYGFEDGDGTRYFSIHATLDEVHAVQAREQLEARLDAAGEDRLVATAEAALRGNWQLLDGVERGSS
jgi:pyrroloquinoline-quinone synthase